jgi:membrane protease YdiL (CAAX protease family)
MSGSGSLLHAPTGRLRTPWRLFVAAASLLAVELAVAGAFAAAGVAPVPGAATGTGLAALLLVLTVNGAAVAVAVLALGRYLDHRVVADLGLAVDGVWWRDLGVGAALGVALAGGAYAVGVGLGVYRVSLDPTAPTGPPLAAWFALAAAAMVAVGVSEELLLRGYLLSNLAEGFAALAGRRVAVAAALAVSSVTFGLLHGSNPETTPLGLLTVTLAGVTLGLGFVATGRLALPVGLHVTWNLAHVLLGVPVSSLELGVRLLETETAGPALVHGGAFGLEGGLLGLGATLLGPLAVVGYARLTGRGFHGGVAEPSLRR